MGNDNTARHHVPDGLFLHREKDAYQRLRNRVNVRAALADVRIGNVDELGRQSGESLSHCGFGRQSVELDEPPYLQQQRGVIEE